MRTRIMQNQEVRAGLALDIVFENEINRPNAHFLKAVIYDCDDKFLIISQTTPALSAQFVGRRLWMTFLVRRENRVLRLGFPAKLVNLISDYEIASGSKVDALHCRKTGDPEPTDFRMYFRVKPPSNADVCLFIEEQKVSLFDISIGGAKFTYPRRYLFRSGDKLQFKLVIGREMFTVDAVIHSVRKIDDSQANRTLQYVSVEFRHHDQAMQTSLGKAIMNIERSLLSEGKM